MTRRSPGKPRPPLDDASLRELALTYVGRFATTRAKLGSYLRRKLRERGWNGEGEAKVDQLVERFASNGYVDDAAYALAKSRSLAGRGYGAARVRQALRADGIADADGEAARALAEEQRVEAALRFARRKRIGPFAAERHERDVREKAIGAMLRAGHALSLARVIVDLDPGERIELDGYSNPDEH